MDLKILEKIKQKKNLFIKERNNFIDTGNHALNWVVSGDINKGYLVGGITELFGEPSTGKTLVLLTGIRQAQKKGCYCIYDDIEYRYNPKWGEKVGVDNDKLIYLHNKKY